MIALTYGDHAKTRITAFPMCQAIWRTALPPQSFTLPHLFSVHI